MKKLMTMMMALSFLAATVSVGFAQETKKTETTAKKKGHKGGKKSKSESTAKKGGSL